jgi:hypothetical protein
MDRIVGADVGAREEGGGDGEHREWSSRGRRERFDFRWERESNDHVVGHLLRSTIWLINTDK